MHQTIKWLRRAAVLVFVGAIAYFFVLRETQAPAVQTVKVEKQNAELVLAVVGRVRSQQVVQIRAETPGAVVNLLHDEGDEVQQGDELAQVRSDEEIASLAVSNAQLLAREAELDLAGLTLKRLEGLAERGLVAKAELDEARAALASARANTRAAKAVIDQDKARIQEFSIRAPVTGIILSRPIDAGQVVGTQDIIFEIGSGGAVEIEAEVDEYYADELKVGMPALLSPSGSAAVYEGAITEVAPRIDPLTGGRLVRLMPDSPVDVFLPGRSIDVNIITERFENAISVPRSALQKVNDGWQVYVVENGKVAERSLQFIDWPGEAVVVQSGINAGDEVLRNPMEIEPGTQVIIDNGAAATQP
tara:strand:+ start:83468 stop:84550 length:1083 start_codon:yes stop_codon:yes gene_type:complete